MIPNIVEIAEDGRYLCKERGFLVVKSGGNELGRVPLDDIGMLMANAHGLTYSNNLLVALADRNVPFFICNSKHLPVAVMWPVSTHHAHVKRFKAQIEASKPMMKRLWQELVAAKIINQSSVIEMIGEDSSDIKLLSRRVKSGDPENVEAHASRIYWKILFGNTFKRNRELHGVNQLLNYGYTIMRSATARAVMLAGLNPSLGIHHHNFRNSMCLVDDLIEPFRPIVDQVVYQINVNKPSELNADTKKILARSYYIDVKTCNGIQPVYSVIQDLAFSLTQVYLKKKQNLSISFKITPFYYKASCQN
ncbi:MAG: type II CRISPR-associated endonuclease Cas1 [Desulfobacteraceae bacterium]|jgi:CRISPR-associated protein Cas1